MHTRKAAPERQAAAKPTSWCARSRSPKQRGRATPHATANVTATKHGRSSIDSIAMQLPTIRQWAPPFFSSTTRNPTHSQPTPQESVRDSTVYH